ncbi:Helitron helicase [Phytophthora megakarya]|uniref:Helitron helicase n=1 Tax=Phytophthora megakarya TaxID=4795 RepID=A0A225VU30_9STRA|nr:Helitron helicase [Phytophthora megakarya]
MTCTSEWKEIRDQIAEHQKLPDRPDIVARVWNQKLRVLGRILARIYVVEFQKRGLPHAHILIILAEEDKPRTRDLINKLVSCEIPDETTNPELYETVMNCMMHGPCGSQNPNCVCMVDGKCFKGYPKPLVEVTRANVDGYAEVQRCRRLPGKLKFKNRVYDNATANQWVVPYNPYLSKKYNCHINIEICTGITVVKYKYKSCTKVPTRQCLPLNSWKMTEKVVQGYELNQTKSFVTSTQSTYLQSKPVFSYSTTSFKANPMRLHLVLFRVDEDPEQVLERSNHSMLTRFFELCASDDPSIRLLKL